ncbi:MAG: excalibur calcium-binding domain-containing protein [Alphaproteobacteria bacterium]|nr:excalibur calcium-binding domain-containing protein [Alphaproteobacteria bacterium]
MRNSPAIGPIQKPTPESPACHAAIPAEWLPPMNKCRFAARVADVKREYRLTADRRHAAALHRVLSACASSALIFTGAQRDNGPAASQRDAAASSDDLALHDDNGNSRITCKEARRRGSAPVPRGHPACTHVHDRDGDGVVGQ